MRIKALESRLQKLAGLPAALIERAKNILSELEASDINNASRRVKAEDKPTQMSMIGETGADADEVCAGVIARTCKNGCGQNDSHGSVKQAL